MDGIIRIASDQDLLLWTGWRYRTLDDDKAWDWWAIYLESGSSRGRHECYAAVAANELQGLMALDLAPSKTIAGRTIAVDYLSTNPANRKPNRGLKHGGVALMAAAAIRSLEHGARGRIWLESLPGAAGFYENLGMARQPQRSEDGNLVYVLEPETAEQLLEEIKAQGIVRL